MCQFVFSFFKFQVFKSEVEFKYREKFAKSVTPDDNLIRKSRKSGVVTISDIGNVFPASRFEA